MNEHFKALDIEKQKRIIRAACREFAMHGYKAASTNRIVESAEIGKGMLFHYFGSKLGLYKYLIEYLTDFLTNAYECLDTPEKEADFIEKYRFASKVKLSVFMENPHLIDLLTRLYLHKDEDLFNDDLKDFFKRFLDIQNKLNKYINTGNNVSKFRDDIPADKLMRYIKWAMDGYTQDILNRLEIKTVISDMDLTPYWAEFDEYLENLKKIYYAG